MFYIATGGWSVVEESIGEVPTKLSETPIRNRMSSAAAASTDKSVRTDANNDRKIFVGNMSYQTRQSELRQIATDLLSAVGVELEDSRVVFRGPRSMGYGFVVVKKSEDVEKAVAALHKHDFDERVWTAERASEPKDRPARERKPRAPRATTEGKPQSDRPPRRRRAPRVPGENDKVSDVTIYVGNLGYHITDDDLAAIFQEFGVKSASIGRSPYGEKRSRGYGLVTFNNTEGARKAIEEMAECECDGRVLVIRAAVEYAPKAESADQAADSMSKLKI